MTCAVLTIQRDEVEHLPRWISYYSRHFDPADVYILDHMSTEGVVLDLLADFPGKVVRLDHPVVLDHAWMRDTVQNAQRRLLNRYDYVLFAEADELLIPDHGTLRDFVGSASMPAYRATGYQVLGDRMFRDPEWDKTLLASYPLNWIYGFHHAMDEPNLSGNLYLYHLHRLDYDEAWAKNQRIARVRGQWDPKAVAHGLGFQSQITDRERFDEWFHDTGGFELEPWHDRIARELTRVGMT